MKFPVLWFLFFFFLMVFFPYDVLGRAVLADEDTADVFAQQTDHDHEHAADDQKDCHKGGPAGDGIRGDQLTNHHVNSKNKADKSQDAAAGSGDAQGLDGERSKSVQP